MKCSFIVPSVGRQIELQKCLLSIIRAYENADKQIAIEVIIVINGGGKDTSFLEIKYPDLTRVYVLEEKGNSHARNYGIQKSRGEYLFFLDDDAFIKEDFLRILSKNILANEAQAFCGRLLNPLDHSPFAKIYQNDKSKYLSHFDYHYLGGTELVIKKETIERIGGFDENFGPGAKYYAAEQTDLFFRLLKLKERIKYIPELIIFHPVIENTPTEKVYIYSYGMGAALMKQIFTDPQNFSRYFTIVLNTLLRSALRSLQSLLFPKLMISANKRFKFIGVFAGTIQGMIGYFKYR